MFRSFASHPEDWESFDLLENQLTTSFQFIQPNPVFVSRLRQNLTNPSEVYMEERKLPLLLAVIGLGLFGSIFLAWSIRRLAGAIR